MLQQHNNSKAHREEVLKLEYLNQPTVSAQLDNQRKKDQEIRAQNASCSSFIFKVFAESIIATEIL